MMICPMQVIAFKNDHFMENTDMYIISLYFRINNQRLKPMHIQLVMHHNRLRFSSLGYYSLHRLDIIIVNLNANEGKY